MNYRNIFFPILTFTGVITMICFLWYLPWEAIVGSLALSFVYGCILGWKFPHLVFNPVSNAPHIFIGLILFMIYCPPFAVFFYGMNVLISLWYFLLTLPPSGYGPDKEALFK